MRRAVCLLVLASAVLVGGYLTRDGDESVATPETRQMIDFMRSTVSYEYEPYETPGAMVAGVDAAVAGHVESVDSAVIADDGDGEGAVIVGLTVSESWKGDYAVGSTLYCTVPRPQNLPVDQYRVAMPEGLQVAVFAHHAPDARRYVSGDPGAESLVPAPQGLFVDGGQGLENVWGAAESADWPSLDSVDKLRAALR